MCTNFVSAVKIYNTTYYNILCSHIVSSLFSTFPVVYYNIMCSFYSTKLEWYAYVHLCRYIYYSYTCIMAIDIYYTRDNLYTNGYNILRSYLYVRVIYKCFINANRYAFGYLSIPPQLLTYNI